MFIDYYENAMIIRPLTCMYSPLRHPCLYGLLFCVLTICLAIMFIIGLITCGLHNNHVYIYHVDFYLILMLHELITCLDVSFH